MKKVLAFLLSCLTIGELSAQISVTATGGTTSGSYSTLAGAFSAINSGTHTGAITLDIASSTTETGPCVLNSSGAGSASYTSVLIRPSADAVVISGPTATGRGLIELNGADSVTIDGDNPGTSSINRNLTITNTAANTITITSVIRIALSTLITSADNITIKNCNINASGTGRNVSTATAEVATFAIIASGTASATSATAAPDPLTSGSTLISSPLSMVNLVIDNNNIQTASRAIAINGGSLNVADGLIISNNIIGNATVGAVDQVTGLGITAQGASNGVISGNTVRVENYLNQNNLGKGIDIGTSNPGGPGNFTIERNRIERVICNFVNTTAATNAYGINCQLASTTTIVRNNFIGECVAGAATSATSFLTTSGGVLGIRIASGTGYKVYNNTVSFSNAFATATGTNLTACFGITATSITGCDIRNNIFSNRHSGGNLSGNAYACIYLPSGATSAMGLIMNNNALFQGTTAISAIGQVGTTVGTGVYAAANFSASSVTPATNMRAYTSAMGSAGGNDSASLVFTSVPPFTSGSDFHIPAGTVTALESAGASVGVASDIDGQTRPGPAGSVNGGAAAPDLGADEFDAVPADITAPAISYTAFSSTTCSTGDRTISGVTITDATGVRTVGTLVPRIYFKKNSGSWYSAAGSLTAGTATSGTWSFTVSASAMGGLIVTDTVSYYIIAQDSAATPNITSNPFGGLVATDVNTVTTPPATPNKFTISATLNGIYTVGSGGAYATITGAATAYNTACLTGPVVFSLISATYPGETFPITITANTSASAANTLTIGPATGVSPTITGSGAPVFTLDGAQYVTIDGRAGFTGTTKALTLSNTTTNAADIRFINGASYDTIQYCTLVSVNTATNTGTIFFTTSTGTTGNSNNLISNCDFVGGATPYVQGIYSSGTAGKENINNTISNCNFADFFSASVATCGINLTTASSGWTITNNRFYQTATRTYTTANTHRAILINVSTGNGFTVNNNVIGYASSSGTGTYAMAGTVTTTFKGIELTVGTTTPSSVQGNTITAISLSGLASALTGIHVLGGSVDVGTTTANTVGSTTATGAVTVTNTGTAAPAITGINAAAASPSLVNIQNNNIGGLTGTGAASAGEGIFGIQVSNTATVNISANTIGSTTTANSINSSFSSTSPSYQVCGVTSSNSGALTISNNTIANLNNAGTSTLAFAAGIIHTGSAAATISGNTVRNISGASGNTSILGQTGVAGIAYTGTGTSTIIQNTVSAIMYTNTASVQSNVAGICYSTSSNGSILRNRIYDLRNASTMATGTTPPTATGILIGSAGGTSTTIANNMISIGNGQTTNTEFMGISNSGTATSALKFYYNSINIEGTVTSGALPTIGFHRGNNSTSAITTSVDLKNNIIRNVRSGGTGKHYAIANGVLVTTASATGWPAGSSNYNILNSNSATVGFWSTDQTIAGWKGASAGDNNSYSGVTLTFNNTATGDLHLNMGTTPNYIESHGTPVTITNDYDNDSRPGPVGSINGGGIIPDLGADEFDGVSIDDVAPAITYTALTATCSTGDRSLTATIIDQSGVPAAGSGTEPRIYYRKGLSGTWYSRPGTLSSGTVTSGTWNFPIVGADMGGVSGADRIYYYVVAQDVATAPNIGANPGTGFAAIGVNTVTAAPTTPNGYLVNYLSGTFNVGVGQTFTTITEAVNSYNTNTCLTGPVTFLLTDAAYSASETYPITINNNPLANSTVTLTIKPATGVAATVTGSSGAAAVFKLLNAQYVTLDGVNTGGTSLNLINSNTGNNTAVVWLASTATTGPGNKNVSLLNMNMTGGIASSTTNWGIAAVVDGATPTAANGIDNDSITVQGNSIKKCGYTLWLAGNAATAAGGLNGWVIKNNLLGPTVYSATDNPGINGTFMRNMTDVVFSGNTLQNIGLTTITGAVVGMYFEGGIDGMVIDSNIVDSVIANTTSGFQVCAFYFNTGNKNVTISRNKITAMYNVNTGGYGARGIVVNNGTAASNFNIVNNFISDVVNYSSTILANWAAGISVDGTSGGVNIYHNSINLYGSHAGLTTATGSADILITSTGGNFDVRNNLLVNSYENTSSTTDKTYGIYSSVAATMFSNIDYNNYYTSGGTPVLGYIGGDRPTLTDMITGFGGNTHSINEPAPFVSPADLHIPASTVTPLESAGIVITGLTTDIDNDVRPGPAGSTYGGGTIPDIGADEFDGVPIDGSAPLISYSALGTSTCATGDRTVAGVTISDFSGVPVTGALMPRIYFKKNAGTWVSDTGTLTGGTATNGTWSFTISAAALGGLAATDVVSYFVIAQDIVAIPNVGAFPGAGLAASNVNTVTTPPTTPYTYTVIPTLSGTYTVGSGGAYSTLTAAVNAYNTACLAGNVTFLLTDATYSTGETFPIVIRNNPNATSSTALTIKPATSTAVTMTGSSGAAAVIKLLNARYVTIDGVNTGGASLTLNNSNVGASAVVWLASTVTTGPGNKYISLLNMNMNGGVNSSATNWGIIAGVDGTTPAATNGMDNDSITVQGNYIKKCGYSLYLMGTAATAAGGLDGWVIKNNILGPSAYSATENLGINGMFMRNMTNVVISGNTMQNVGFLAATNAVVGIYMETGIDGLVVDSNIVDSVMTASTSSIQVCAYYLGSNVKNATISRNKISSMYNLNTSGYGARGITVNNATAASNVNIVNNFISDVVSYSQTATANWPVGIGLDGTSGGINIYHNSISLSGTHPGLASATGSADIFVGTSVTGLDVRNNLLVNTYDNTSSSTDKTYTVYSFAPASIFTNIDYNNYYASGGTGVLGYIGSADRLTLTDMIAGFGGNTHAISNSALFMSPVDLHLQPFSINVPLIAGASLTAVPADIDGTSRSTTTPVIGAHEVNIPPCSGAPVPGVVTASVLGGCGTFNSNLTLTGSSTGSGLDLQWQSSPDSSTWTNITGATTLTYNPSVTTTTYYRVGSTCTVSSLSDVTPGVLLVSHPFATISGPAITCTGGSITLSASPAGGTWVSGSTSTVTIDAATGVATGGSMGTAPITFTSTAGCVTATGVAVVSAPSDPAITPAFDTICEGGSVAMTAVATYSTNTTITSGTLNFAVPATVTGSYSPLSIALPAGATITGASVIFNVATTYVGDLTINLTAPNGNTLNLFNRHGSGGDNLINTVVSSTATTPFPTTGAPYTGTYAATAATGSTIGITGYMANVTTWAGLFSVPNGTWTLSVRDNVSADPTTFNSWGITLNYTVPSDITWSPTGTLYASADLTTPYTGAATSSVYAKPTAPGTVATVNSYIATASVPGCSVSTEDTAIVTVNPLPSPIVGSDSICHGLVTTLSDPDAGGIWTSGNTTVAAIGATSGIVDGLSPGTATIAYTFTGTGCARSITMTVNALPDTITGTASVCQAATTTLADATSLGTWASDASSIAGIDISTGVVTGGAAGLAMISYILPTGCMQTKQVTVNPLPVLSVSPAASATICEGGNATFIASSPLIEFPVLSQDFNGSTLGAWTITNSYGDAANVWQLTSTPFSTTTGDGTTMLETAPSAGTTSAVHTILTSPGFSTVGFGSAILSFNEYLFSIAGDITVAVEYSVDNGATWSPLLDQIGAMVEPASWTAASPQISIPLPSAALNVPNVKLRWNYESYGVSWAIDNIYVKGALPAANFTWAGVGAADGLSCTTCDTVVIAPTLSGANIYNVTANSTCSSNTNVTVNVNPLPGAIGGATAMLCVGNTISLSNPDAGGSWSGSDPAIASVDPSTGALTGVATGTAVISYTLPTACARFVIVTVNAAPAPIVGTMHVCEDGSVTTLTHAVSAGTWASSNNALASIDAASGIVTGNLAGSVNITYTLPSGCYTISAFSVDSTPAAFTGSLAVCEFATSTLSSASVGGTWSSTNPAAATVDPSSGVVGGVAAGNADIIYTLPTGCQRTATATVNTTPAITGADEVCESATTIESAIPGGSWSIGSAVATVDATGTVSGVAAGTTVLSYAMSGTGCLATKVMSVNPLPAAFSGTMSVCEGESTTLGNPTPGGTWSTPSTAASVDAVGVVTGSAAGTASIIYTLPTTCSRIATVTVLSVPAPVTGAMTVCVGNSTSLTSSPLGGTWSSSPSLNASVDGAGNVTGVFGGTSLISYTGTNGCVATATVTVNVVPPAIGGVPSVCENATTTLTNGLAGGAWSSSAPVYGTVDAVTGAVGGIAPGTTDITYTLAGCSATVNVVVNALPGATTGVTDVCEGLTATLSNATPGGTWTTTSSSASIDLTTGVVTGVVADVVNISYTLPTGCNSITPVTVNALPADISGPGQVCQGSSIALTDATPSGTWFSSDGTVAAIDASGNVTGALPGSANIVYTAPNGCVKTLSVVVDPVPTISGPDSVCEGAAIALLGMASGGTWTSSAPGTASVNIITGSVAGVVAGTATMTYALTTGCSATAGVTVKALPAPIAGIAAVCPGTSVSLSSVTPGGTWSDGGSAFATVSTAGVLTGIAAGSAIVTYTGVNGCAQLAGMVVNAAPATFGVTGGGPYCAGTAGSTIGLSSSDASTVYQLYLGSTPVGPAMPGIGGPLNLGVFGAAGTYTVLATDPVTGCTQNMLGTAMVSVTSSVVPTVTAGAAGGTMVCAGTVVTFSATPVSGGTMPSYTWIVNGATILSGSTSGSFSYIPVNGDVVVVALNSSAACAMPSVVNDTLTMTVNPLEMPVATIALPPGVTSVCEGSPVTLTVTSVFGGTAPAYTWYFGGSSTGVTTTSYSYTPTSGDVVYCELVSSFGCVVTSTVNSNTLTMLTTPVYVPSVAISVAPGTVITSGTPVSFTALVTGGGPAPIYQWYNGSTAIPGETNYIYTTSALADNDSISCKVTGTEPCGYESFNSVIMKVRPNVGITQVGGTWDVALVPNPNNGHFTVRGSLASKTDEELTIEVVNVLGQKVYSAKTTTRSGKVNESIQLDRSLAHGMYLLNLHAIGETQVFHFVLEQ